MWFQQLKEFFRSLGFIDSWANPSLSIYTSEGAWVYLFDYINDIVIMGSNGKLVQVILDKLDKEFATNKLGVSNNFLNTCSCLADWRRFTFDLRVVFI